MPKLKDLLLIMPKDKMVLICPSFNSENKINTLYFHGMVKDVNEICTKNLFDAEVLVADFVKGTIQIDTSGLVKRPTAEALKLAHIEMEKAKKEYYEMKKGSNLL